MQPTHFTMEDLMDVLVSKAGLPRDATTTDPAATFADIDLDSLAYLQLGAEIAGRFGFELDDPIGKLVLLKAFLQASAARTLISDRRLSWFIWPAVETF